MLNLYELEGLYEQHKYDEYRTFEVSWKDVIYDCIQEIKRLKEKCGEDYYN